MEEQRSLTVDTPYGDSDKFNPKSDTTRRHFITHQGHKTDVLQDKNYGLNLMQLKDKLDQQSLNNISTHIRSESTTGTIVRAAIKVASRKAIKNILQCPISSTKITTNTNNLIADISRKLVK
jgi:hypothetical protein